MAEKQQDTEATGIRRRVVDSAKERLKSAQKDLSDEFSEEYGQLLGAAKVPKAEAFLTLFEKRVDGA